MSMSSSPSSPNKRIEHCTDIFVKNGEDGLKSVWNAIVDIDDWKWNKWTRLEASKVVEGIRGKLHASYEGNDKFETFDFTFAEVNHEDHILSWTGSLGPGGCLFRGYHSMKLELISTDASDESKNKMQHSDLKTNMQTIRITHTEEFSGMLPFLWIGLPYKILNRNYRLMNESLKDFVESRNG